MEIRSRPIELDKELPLVFPTTGHEPRERGLKVDVASCASPNSIAVPQFWTVAAAETSHRRFRRDAAPRHPRAARTRLTSRGVPGGRCTSSSVT